MNDPSNEFLAARFAAVANPLDDSDWLDVRRRAEPRRRRRWFTLPLAAAVGVLLASSAFAFYGRVVDFISAEPAPERVVMEFDKLGAVIRGVRLGPNVNSSEARRITSPVVDGEPRPLYVAPTSDGGFCWQWHFIGKCGRTRPDEPPVSNGWLQGEHGGAQLIFGHILDSRIQRLELEYEDGLRTDIPLVWVTAPIDAGFYQFEVPPEHLLVGHRTALIRALDEDGNEVAQNDFLLQP